MKGDSDTQPCEGSREAEGDARDSKRQENEREREKERERERESHPPQNHVGQRKLNIERYTRRGLRDRSNTQVQQPGVESS